MSSISSDTLALRRSELEGSTSSSNLSKMAALESPRSILASIRIVCVDSFTIGLKPPTLRGCSVILSSGKGCRLSITSEFSSFLPKRVLQNSRPATAVMESLSSPELFFPMTSSFPGRFTFVAAETVTIDHNIVVSY